MQCNMSFIVIVVFLLIAAIPTNAQFVEGSGTEEDPFQVAAVERQAIAESDHHIYWFDYENKYLMRGNVETWAVDTLSNIERRQPVAFDIVDGELYWVDGPHYHNDLIIFRKGDPQDDGTDFFSLTNDGSSFFQFMLRVDIPNGYFYWLENGSASRIRRARTDGSGLEEVVTSGKIIRFRIDHTEGKLYWVEVDGGIGSIHRSNLDGSQVEDLMTEQGYPRIGDIEIDESANQFYWTVPKPSDDVKAGIYRAGLDGRDIEHVIDSRPYLLTLDSNDNYLYWTDDAQWGTIIRVKPGETVTDTVLSVPDIRLNPNDLIFYPMHNKLYWVEGFIGSAGLRIMQSDSDGNNVQEVLAGFGDPVSVAIDPVEKKAYWTTGWSREVMKVELNGSNLQAIIREYVATSTPYKGHIFLDRDNDKLYWWMYTVVAEEVHIRYAPTDGSGIKRIPNPLKEHGDLESAFTVDSFNDRIYGSVRAWSTDNRRSLIRFDDDEAQVILDEDLSSRISDYALNHETGQLYWTELVSGKIRRVNFDGTGLEDVLHDLDEPLGITMDVENGKMYWTERESGKIRRANLDGTETEDLFTGLSDPGRPFFTFENSGIPTSVPIEDRPVSYQLHQNYPNPFNPVTVIEYSLPQPETVTLQVYDVTGRLVETLVDQQHMPAGRHHAIWDASGAASGLYLYRLQTGDFEQSRTMTLVK